MPMSRTASADLDDYRIASPSEILALMHRLESERSLVTLSGPDGSSYTTLVWGVDTSRGTLTFSADNTDPQLKALLGGDEVQAVAYLDRIKVQFDLDGLVQVHGGQVHSLNAHLPREVFRFQRRSAFRVQPFGNPAMPDMKVALRVLDVSLSGVALLLPENVPAIAADLRINHCTLRLDAETELDVAILIHHITPLQPEGKGPGKGSRLGCELLGLNGQDRSLQHYINQTQKRRIVLAG